MVQIQGEKKECEIFSFLLSICGFYEEKSRIHVSSNGDRSVCFSVKENSEMAQEQEHSFRGSISLAECNALLAL